MRDREATRARVQAPGQLNRRMFVENVDSGSI
jgi:hypothetical protein